MECMCLNRYSDQCGSHSISVLNNCSSPIFSCSPIYRVDPGACPSHPASRMSASTLSPVALAFEEAAVNQATEASHSGSEPLGHEDATGYDAFFGHDHARGFLQHLRVSQDLNSEECKRSDHLHK